MNNKYRTLYFLILLGLAGGVITLIEYLKKENNKDDFDPSTISALKEYTVGCRRCGWEGIFKGTDVKRRLEIQGRQCDSGCGNRVYIRKRSPCV